MEEEASTIPTTMREECIGRYSEKFKAQSKFIPDNPDLEAAQNAVARFCGEICAYNEFRRRGMASDMPGRWLTLSGRSGCGKTMLAKEAYAFVKANAGIFRVGKAEITAFGEVVRYEDFVERNSILFYEQGELQDTLFAPTWRNRDAEDAFFVATDDLGAGHNSEFLTEKLGELLNRRMGRWTLITTNLSQKDIAEVLDTRIASRITRDGNALQIIKSGDYCYKKLKNL